MNNKSETMMIEKYNRPILFFSLSTIIPWFFWFMAAWMSYQSQTSELYSISWLIFGLLGLFSPTIIAFAMMIPNPSLREDLYKRIFKFKKPKSKYIFFTCFLMLASLLLAQAISLLFGYSASQFSLSGSFSFSSSFMPPWFLLILAPLIEELAWHSYGTDSLRVRFNLFITSTIFAVYWAVWHFPLSFIKDYYHSNVVETGWLYGLNFYVSLIPFVIVMNWIYYKTDRNILIAIVFHITAGIVNEIFATHPMSKVIQTGLLTILAIYLLVKERDFFFIRDHSKISEKNETNGKIQDGRI